MTPAELAELRAGHCLSVIPDTFIACGEGLNFCSETCRLRAEVERLVAAIASARPSWSAALTCSKVSGATRSCTMSLSTISPGDNAWTSVLKQRDEARADRDRLRALVDLACDALSGAEEGEAEHEGVACRHIADRIRAEVGK